MDNYFILLAMIIGAGLLVMGLVVGYWRGMRRRIIDRKANDNLDTLVNMGQSILTAQLDLDALCEIVYQQCTRIIDTRNFQLGLFDGDDYVIKVRLQDARRLEEHRYQGSGRDGLIGWIRSHKRGILVNNFETEWDSLPARPRAYNPNIQIKSAIFAPLIAGGEVIGVIGAQSSEPAAFTENDLRDLTVFANQAAGSLHNAQLYEAVRLRARRLRLIAEVTRQITAIQPLPDLFKQIVDMVQETFGYYLVNIYTIEESTQDIVLGASTANDDKLKFGILRVQHSEGIIGWVATQGETAAVPNVEEDDRYLHIEGIEATRSELVVPLMIEGLVLGILDIQSNKLDDFDKDDIATLELLAAQLALAIQEAFTYSAERRQAERLNALIEAARAVVSILDIDNLLDEVVDLINDHFDYDRVHLFLRHEDKLIMRSGSGVHSERWLMENLYYDLGSDGIIAWVARNSEPAVLQNVAHDSRYVVGPGLEDTKSEMAVPILMGKNVLGVLDIQSPEVDAFRRQDITLVEALADTLAVALRNASLFANEKRRRILAETLREVSTVLASALDLESVLKQILLGMERVVGYNAALILLMDDDGENYHVSAVHGMTVTEDLWGQQIPANENFETVLDHMLVVQQDEEFDPTKTAPLPVDTLSVGLSLGDQRIGYLAIRRVATQSFTTEEKEIVTTFANQAALAIMNAQLYMAQKEEAWISTALLEVAKATGQALSLEESLETVARITLLLAGVEWCGIFLSDGDLFRLAQIAGAGAETMARVQDFSMRADSWQPLQDMVETGYPILMNNETPRPPNMPINVEVLQAVILPLYTKGDILGAMLIGQGPDNDPLTERKVELLAGIANQAALAIDGAQLYTAQQEEAWVTTVLLQVAEAVNTQYDLDSTLEIIVRLMTMLVGVTKCAIFYWEGANGYFRGMKSSGLSEDDAEQVKDMVLPMGEDPFLTQLMDIKQPLSAGEKKAFAIPKALDEIFQIPRILGIPLIVQNTPVAIMIVDHIDLEGHSGERRMDILTGVAYQSALAIETAHLQEEALAARGYEREIEVARDIQLSLLPEKPPEINGWEVAAYYRPARLVGGDFYDFIPLSNGHYALVIADVADKGIPAAMFMTVCRTLIRAVASSQKSACETLERVNRLLVRDSRSNLFFTCWFAILDPATGRLQFTNGGHNPPLLVRADGRVEELKIKGMALGIVEPSVLKEQEITLEDGDILLCYTDGLTEAPRSDMVEFGETELYVNTIKYRNHSATKMVTKIIAAIDKFTAGQPAFDDLTVFAIKRLEDKQTYEQHSSYASEIDDSQ